MTIRFLLDENLRGPLWRAILRHNASGGLPIVVICVGDLSVLPFGSADEALLIWCERASRILVSLDHATLPVPLRERIARGAHVPGVFLIRPGASLPGVLEALELVAHAGDADDYRDRVIYIP